MLRALLRWSLRLLLAVLVAAGVLAAYARWAYRDIPVETLEQQYAGADLRVAEVDGVPIRYRLAGSGPLVVLIHSHYFDMHMWDAWVPTLAAHFSVLRYDLSGHGLTGPDPSGVYTVDRDVELLEGLLKKLGVEPYAVVGSSLGGNIAFTYAARAPQRVQALVLINSGGLKRATSRSGKGIPAWADQVLALVPPWALRRFLHWMIADDRVIDAALETRFIELWRRDGNRTAEIGRLRQFETGEPDALLARITAPTLILWGADNPQLPAAMAAEFEKKLTASPRVVRKVYPGAGHVLPLERPQASADDTAAFLLTSGTSK